MENWRPAPGWPRYEVSDLGNVRRSGGRRLRLMTSKAGYKIVHLTRPGEKSRKRPVHRLVNEAFNGPPPAGMPDTLHGPLGKAVNIPTNLRWGNDRLNYADRSVHGEGGLLDDFKHKPGEHHRFARLDFAAVEQIRSLSGAISQREIGRRFGISQSHVSEIIGRKKWSASTEGGESCLN